MKGKNNNSKHTFYVFGYLVIFLISFQDMDTKNPKICLPFSKQNKHFAKWQNSAQTWTPSLGNLFFLVLACY
jgi:hypothetical protein